MGSQKGRNSNTLKYRAFFMYILIMNPERFLNLSLRSLGTMAGRWFRGCVKSRIGESSSSLLAMSLCLCDSATSGGKLGVCICFIAFPETKRHTGSFQKDRRHNGLQPRQASIAWPSSETAGPAGRAARLRSGRTLTCGVCRTFPQTFSGNLSFVSRIYRSPVSGIRGLPERRKTRKWLKKSHSGNHTEQKPASWVWGEPARSPATENAEEPRSRRAERPSSRRGRSSLWDWSAKLHLFGRGVAKRSARGRCLAWRDFLVGARGTPGLCGRALGRPTSAAGWWWGVCAPESRGLTLWGGRPLLLVGVGPTVSPDMRPCPGPPHQVLWAGAASHPPCGVQLRRQGAGMTLTSGLVGRFLGSQGEPYSEEPLWSFQCLQPRTHPTPAPLRLGVGMLGG